MSEKHVHVIELDRWDSEGLVRIFREKDDIVEIRISVLEDGMVNVQVGGSGMVKIWPPKSLEDLVN